jgi:hypothetical protein
LSAPYAEFGASHKHPYRVTLEYPSKQEPVD